MSKKCIPWWREAVHFHSTGPLLEVEMSKKCTPLWCEDVRSTFGSEYVQNTRGSDHFLTLRWRFDVEKVHAYVARSTFGSQKWPKQQALIHFLKCQVTNPSHWISVSNDKKGRENNNNIDNDNDNVKTTSKQRRRRRRPRPGRGRGRGRRRQQQQQQQ